MVSCNAAVSHTGDPGLGLSPNEEEKKEERKKEGERKERGS